MHCTWHSKRNSSLTCTPGFSAALPLGWVTLFAWHVLFVWVGNTEMSCLELVPAGKKLWCQVVTQLGNARTTTGTEGLTVWYPIIWTAGENLVGFSFAFEGNNALVFIDFIGDLTLRAASNDGATDTISLKTRLMRTAFFSKLVLKSFKTTHHLFNLYQPWKTFLFANILRSFACRKSWKLSLLNPTANVLTQLFSDCFRVIQHILNIESN